MDLWPIGFIELLHKNARSMGCDLCLRNFYGLVVQELHLRYNYYFF